MSGTNYNNDCPECGRKATLFCYSDYKPYDMAEGTCIHCGFHYFTKEGKLSPEALKEFQKGEGYDPKTKTFKENNEKIKN